MFNLIKASTILSISSTARPANFCTSALAAAAVSSTSTTASTMTTTNRKRILFLRHGQALHNPRAEEAKENGCSYETFMNLMREDDAFDAHLTELGESQAVEGRLASEQMLQGIELIVSSPLSRALKTADLTVCPEKGLLNGERPPRICVEDFREINGWLLNAKRRERGNLQERFHKSWNFDQISPTDELWTDTLETQAACAERGYQGLIWLTQRNEDKIMVVAHGGILRFMAEHPGLQIVDERAENEKRFSNCELREYEMVWSSTSNTDGSQESRPLITLTEV